MFRLCIYLNIILKKIPINIIIIHTTNEEFSPESSFIPSSSFKSFSRLEQYIDNKMAYAANTSETMVGIIPIHKSMIVLNDWYDGISLKFPIIIIEIERSIGTKESFKISLLVYTLKGTVHNFV